MTKHRKTSRVHDENTRIGQNIRDLRNGAGLTLQDIADHLNLTYQQVQKYETGTNRFPLQYLPALCDLLGVPAEVFLNGLVRSRKGADADIVRVQLCVARVRDRELRQKIVRVVDILAA